MAAMEQEALPAQCTEAYVTLVTSDSFVMGAENLLHSIRSTQTSRSVVVMVTEHVSSQKLTALANLATAVVPVPIIRAPPVHNGHTASWTSAEYTKLNIWGLVQFGKVVYVDADCLLLQNVDELFDRDTVFAAAPDVFPPDKFNAGVMVLRPDAGVLEDMKAKLGSLPSHDGGDTGFLNSYFSTWYEGPPPMRLPFGYNALRTVHWMTHTKNPGYWLSIQPLKIIHYCSSPKPWEDASRKGDLEMLWWNMYVQSRVQGLALGLPF